MKTGYVLQVEDDANDIYLVQYAFSEAGAPDRVKAVRDVEEAVAYLSGTGDFENRADYPVPALVLLDLQLPGGSGFDVLKWIREQADFCALPVVVLSSSSRSEDIQTAYQMGANAYLVKPSGVDELLQVVKCLSEFWLGHNQTSELPRLSKSQGISQAARPY
jgi:CheY-like chemotaxis protein